MFGNDKRIYHVLSAIIDESKGCNYSFCYMRNSSGKEWLFDDSSIKTVKWGLNIYEPQAIKGKVIKELLPYLYSLFEQKDILGIKKINLKISLDFLKLISDTYRVDIGKIHINLFLGTPSVHQKIVMQIDDGAKILGYVKLSDNEDVIESFRKETDCLKTLKSKGVQNISDALFWGRIKNVGIFAQSSQKNKHAFSDPTLNKVVINFVRELMKKTKTKVRWEDSDYYKLISIEEADLSRLPNNKILLMNAIELIKESHKEEVVVLYAAHGDFTPWNSFYNRKNDLYVFDFEYSMESCTAYYDLYHWFVSDCIFRLHYGYEQIVDAFEKSIIRRYVKNAEQLFVLYLLGIICFYLKRDGENKSDDNQRNIEIWIKLLEHYGRWQE